MKIIRIFEHQTLKVGDVRDGVAFTELDFQGLAALAEKNEEKYFKVVNQGIRFSQYVGIVQVGALSIEILPKTDARLLDETGTGQSILLDMLQYSHFQKLESFQIAAVRPYRHALLHYYMALFLEATRLIWREGLLKSYTAVRENSTTLKGQIKLHQQLTLNALHEERLYIQYQKHSFDHPFNAILYRTLQVLKHFPLPPALSVQLNQLLQAFPQLKARDSLVIDWDRIHFDRSSLRYRAALELARPILENYHPDIRHGEQSMLAILFDMNQLFEEYLFQRLKALSGDYLRVFQHQRRPFWRKSYLQPDILLEMGGRRFVLDAKWKMLTNPQPTMSDLRQMYIYSRFYHAENAVLLYPKSGNTTDTMPIYYAETAQGEKDAYTCQLCFLPILKDNRLNQDIAIDLIRAISPDPASVPPAF
ncbi:MAG TPA: hypothetical protein PKA00_10570 [Saprospiraceae bacterium]|nr:hypothetical protein [Saprospiraceae bacterium]HMQ83344.1 hypothetical protein [Saprospiraceae bacterium]